jgi:putative aldouronate transport system permease protein
LNKGIHNKLFNCVVTILVAVSVVLCIIPFLYVVAVSLSSNSAIVSELVTLYPIEFNIDAYKTVFTDSDMMYSLGYTIVLTLVYTLMCMIVTILAAYPLSKKNLRGRSLLLGIFMFTMYFSGGLIPDYILVKNLSLLNTVWSLVFPGLMSIYYMIILKSFFQSIPESLEEAAVLDGCNYFTILMKIVLPLSMPAIATISLFYAVGRWDGFMDALFYITKPELYPIQLKLYQIISMSQQLDIQKEGVGTYIAPMGMKAASVIFAMIPILMAYPWLQRYFVSGVMLGAVKG